MAQHQVTTKRGRLIEDPGIARFLFSDTRSSILWLVLRVWLGLQWLDAGWHKVVDPGWTQSGDALKTFWERIVVVPATGRPVIAFDWYRDFIQALLNMRTYTWFAPLVAWGELLIGIALIIGAFVGIAAFFGALMNWNFIMAGSASSNGLLLIIALFLIMAWKVAGYLGADYFLLRWLGVPWKTREAPEETTPTPSMGATPAH